MRDEYRAGMDAIAFEQTFQRRLIDRMLEEVERQEHKTPVQAWIGLVAGMMTIIGVIVWLFGSRRD